MPPTKHPGPARRSEARERLLSTASELFYTRGIGSVGVDRIVSDSRVTLATFYRHFPSKQDLVVGYLENIHAMVAARTATLSEQAHGRELIRAIGNEVSADASRPGFRGCAFINAASEFEDADDPVRKVVARHRAWYHRAVRDAFADAGHTSPGNAARHFVMLRDGAMTAGYLDSPVVARRTFNRGVEGLLLSIDVKALAPGEDDLED